MPEVLFYFGNCVCRCVLLASSVKKKIHILLILIEKVISVFTVLIFVNLDFQHFWLDLRKRI